MVIAKKYKVTISMRNSGDDYISIAGSNIVLSSGRNMFPAAGKCGLGTSYTDASGDVRLAFPGQALGFLTELKPSYNVSNSYVVYTNDTYPKVSYYITLNYMNIKKSNGSSQNITTQNNANTITGNSAAYQSIQEAIAKFNSLINQAGTVDQQRATQIQNNIQTALNNNRNTENFKLNIVNNGIRDLENLIARKNTNSNNLTTQSNNSAQQTQQNDLTEYNRSKADLERRMQQQNQEIANHNAEVQRQQQLLKQQQEEKRQQQLQQGINQLTTATVDLASYFANRKNALRNSLSKEDGQALIDIVNSENPTNYTQNIIQIFKGLGYTLRKTEHEDNYVIITLNNDVANINDFMLIFIHPASDDFYNSISFRYREKKLRERLAVLGGNLKGLELKGISPSNAQKKEAKELREKAAQSEKENATRENIQKITEITPVKSDKIIGNDITVQSIIDKCITAMGGEEKLSAVENIFEYCENEKSSSKTIITFGKYSSVGVFEGKSSKIIFDGIKGYIEYDGRIMPMDEMAVLSHKKSQPFCILELKSRQDLTLGTIETVEQKDYVTIIKPLELINGMTISTKFYFEMDNGLYFGTATSISSNNTTSVSYNFNFDYKEVNGIKFPFTRTSTYRNNSSARLTYNNSFTKTITTQIKINEPLTDNDFK